ncbi:hypothetical protein BGZ82_002896 [Podila clonocystis]|nr:hypothetical protein BGZ82_002896 [Podila clonocystis]
MPTEPLNLAHPSTSSTPPTSSWSLNENPRHAEGLEHWEERLKDHGFEVDYTIIDRAVSIWMDNGRDGKEVSCTESDTTPSILVMQKAPYPTLMDPAFKLPAHNHNYNHSHNYRKRHELHQHTSVNHRLCDGHRD